MLTSRIGKGRAYDVFHKGAVLICVVVSAVGFSSLSLRFTQVLLLKKEKEKAALEQGKLQDVADVYTSENVQKL